MSEAEKIREALTMQGPGFEAFETHDAMNLTMAVLLLAEQVAIANDRAAARASAPPPAARPAPSSRTPSDGGGSKPKSNALTDDDLDTCRDCSGHIYRGFHSKKTGKAYSVNVTENEDGTYSARFNDFHNCH